jgi:phosphonoacetaldehyde hydrolase
MNINTLEEEATLSKGELARRLARTREMLQNAGAHYVIDSLADIEPVIADVEHRLARGEKP